MKIMLLRVSIQTETVILFSMITKCLWIFQNSNWLIPDDEICYLLIDSYHTREMDIFVKIDDEALKDKMADILLFIKRSSESGIFEISDYKYLRNSEDSKWRFQDGRQKNSIYVNR